MREAIATTASDVADNASAIATNTGQIAANTEIMRHIDDITKLYGPMITLVGVLIMFIIGLLVWAWRRMEATQAKMEKVFTDHVKENDKLHNQLFTQLRETEAKLNELLGEHKAQHSNGAHP